ncbi:hypothetical protein CALVIDRAFT_536718 [Calocera viscosa TUFC12733]|uniref:Uncharacterized protein n=1 Tax=Calocera viscosa (strain TUFC12733) TaxID=1330018 RepID=A0A167MK14_CALVF|nr:hypothetical protein CALVIDRAFT_536718 [Calocera viscosa TUFC12733]
MAQKPVEEEQTADMIPEPSTPGSIPADDLPMPRKLVVKPEPLISAENLRTPNPLKAPRQKTQWDHESKYPHVARQERPGSAKPHGAERDGAAKHPAQPAFQKPKGVDAPTAAESKSNGKKRRQDERDSDTILESRRAKKQKKQKQKKPAEE